MVRILIKKKFGLYFTYRIYINISFAYETEKSFSLYPMADKVGPRIGLEVVRKTKVLAPDGNRIPLVQPISSHLND
jgi:hypothetical protein